MSQSDKQQDKQPNAGGALRTDSLSVSIVLLITLAGLQRLIGLARNVLFCGLLSDEQLGRWSLAYSFLLLAAPLVVLGIPGSFGRYVEHYRQQIQLRSFLRSTVLASGLAAIGAAAVMIVWPRPVAWLLFADPTQVGSVRLLGAALVSVIAFNFLVELLTALRLVRAVALMQLVSSLLFAVTGALLLSYTALGEEAVVIAYGIAMLLAGLLGAGWVLRCFRGLPAKESVLTQRTLWSKLLPFAGWVWIGNLIANLFAVTDQFMLKHLSGLAPAAADALVGQYYCSRIIPLLIVGLASLVASGFLPHLIEDWETGRRDVVDRRVRLAVKLATVGFTVAAAIVLVAAPLLFGVLLGGKYDAGLAVLPGTLAYCVWFSVFCVLSNYLLCAEKARLGSYSLALGLVVNVVLNFILAPRYGLPGVVFATTLANLLTLLLLHVFCRRSGMSWDHRSWLVLVLPAGLCLGGGPALAVVLIVVLAGWIFDQQERQQFLDEIAARFPRALPKHEVA
jgi:O-antigen/teichoic acid export membrane protein